MKPTINTSPLESSWITAGTRPSILSKSICMSPHNFKFSYPGYAQQKARRFRRRAGIPMIALLSFYRPPPTRLMHGDDGGGDGSKKPLRVYASEPREDVSI